MPNLANLSPIEQALLMFGVFLGFLTVADCVFRRPLLLGMAVAWALTYYWFPVR